MGVFRRTNDWCVDDDRLEIWSFEGVVGKSAYNELVKHYGIKEVVINTGHGSVIPKAIFKDCKEIEEVEIKEGVTSIGSYAFDGCSSLMNITIPDSVTSIGDYAFFRCSNLKNISIPAQLEIRPKGIVDSDCAITRRPEKEANMTETNNTEKRKEVDLYDPKFVHFEWDENLKDKKGFCGGLINELRADVRNNGEKGVCDRFGDPGFPFHIKDVGLFRFFYYDPHYNIKRAYFKEGKPVQIRRNSTEEWKDLYPYESVTAAIEWPKFFDDDYEYRIKPEEKVEPKIEVNVDVKVNNTSSDNKIKITINGKECVFENAEQARMVLKG